MAKQKLVRNQHVVSRFYLKGFAKEASMLLRIVLPGEKSHLTPVSKATVIRDFYTVPLADGQPSDFIEVGFSVIEDQTAPILERIINQGYWPLESADKQALALWIALQYFRGESYRALETETEALLIGRLVEVSGRDALRYHIENAEGRAVTREQLDFEWTELTKPGGPTLRPDTGEHMGILAERLLPTAESFARKEWKLVEFKRKPLLTGDHPVSLVSKSDHPHTERFGLDNAMGVVLPLSRYCALSISLEGPQTEVDQMEPGTAKLAAFINNRTIRNSRTSLYLHPDDTGVVEDHDLQDPKKQEWNPDQGCQLIKDMGWFSDAEERAKKGLPAALVHENGEVVSLSDIVWPIVRRVNVWHHAIGDA